jgi:UDP-glucose 4-epimerase
MRTLASGATGFLGGHVTPLLRGLGPLDFLSRSPHEGAIRADLTQWDGGIDPVALRDRYDAFVHMAGMYDLRASQIDAYRQNIASTHAALTIAEKAGIRHFVHVSTIAVAMGDALAPVGPDALDASRAFSDHYSASKAHAEEMVRMRGSFDSVLILRLGILVGDTLGGPIHRVDGPYFVAEAFRRLKPWISAWPGPLWLPGNPDVRLPIVPVDVASQAMVRLIGKMHDEDWKGVRSLYLAPREGLSPGRLYEASLKRIGIEKGFELIRRIPDALVSRVAEVLGQLPREETEYVLRMPRLETSATEEILGRDWCPEFDEFEEAFWQGYEKHVSNR